MSQWCADGRSSGGKLSVRSCSTASTVFPSESPMRRATLKTCVSTAITGLLYTTDAITLAVLRPTPGILTSRSGSEGTVPPNSSSSVRAIPIRCLALLFGNEIDFIRAYTSSKEASASDCGSGNLLNRAGVYIFTLLSVHCADKMTAISREANPNRT